MTLKGKILAVDDEAGITEYLQTLFTGAGFDVQTANGGWQAWDKICNEPFDFVITDVRMEHGDGIELVEKVRDMPKPKPLIAIMSAYTDVLISDVYDRGAVAFISKPPKSSALIHTVNKALSHGAAKWDDTGVESSPTPLSLNLESMDLAIKLGVLSFGTGGMFLQVQNELPPEEQVVNFTIKFSSGAIHGLHGRGITKWTRLNGSRLFYAGIGIEFIYLSPESKAFVLDHIETFSPTAFIPVGMIPPAARN